MGDLTILLRGFLASNEQADAGIAAHLVLCHGTHVLVVICVVAVESLSSCTGPNAEDDGVHQLRRADAFLIHVADLM